MTMMMVMMLRMIADDADDGGDDDDDDDEDDNDDTDDDGDDDDDGDTGDVFYIVDMFLSLTATSRSAALSLYKRPFGIRSPRSEGRTRPNIWQPGFVPQRR